MNDSNNTIIKQFNMAKMSKMDICMFSSVFKMGKIKADTYCPSPEEFDEIIDKNLPKYMPFLLWIDETGFTTAENEERREYLRRFIYEKLIVV